MRLAQRGDRAFVKIRGAPAGKDAVDMENGCITEQEMCANVEYLVLGHFERKQGDTKGTHTMLWLAIADFDKLGRVQRGGRR